MSRRRWLAAGALGVWLGACGGDAKAPVPKTTEVAPSAAPKSAAERYVAVLAPAKASDVAPRFVGELLSVKVGVGERVDAGQALATVDPRDLRSQLSETDAARASAQAALRQAGVQLEDAKRRRRNEKRAVAAGTSAKRSLEEAEFALESAKAARAQARARVAEAAARSRQISERMEDTEIVARFAGTVGSLYRSPGAMVGPDAPILRLIGDQGIVVRFAVDASRAKSLVIGARLSLAIEGEEAAAEVEVEQIAPEVDSASRLVFVVGSLHLDPGQVGNAPTPGTAAWVTIPATP